MLSEQEIDDAIALLPEETKTVMARNYYTSITKPVHGVYYISNMGRQIIERLQFLKDPAVLAIRESIRS